MKCTAPIRGHSSSRAWSRCPPCRGGSGWTAPRVSGGHTSGATTAGAKGTILGRIATPTTSAPNQMPSPQVSSRAGKVERDLIAAGLDFLESRNFTAALIDVSVALEAEASKRATPSHWLCQLLADSADAVDPATIASIAGDVFADALVANGAPEWAASIAGWGVAKAAEGALSSMMPGVALSLGLRVLGMLVCPSPSSCPAATQLSAPVLKTALAAPAS